MKTTAQFQSFEVRTDPKQSAPRLALLREELHRQGFDGFLVPRADEYQGEYVPARAERIAWLTGFTGSAAYVIALRDRAAFFTDGRYTLQAQEQVDLSLFTLEHMVQTPPSEWMRSKLRAGERIGYDPWLHTPNELERLRNAARSAGAELVATARNAIDAVWSEQPPAPLAPFVVQKEQLAGVSSKQKRDQIAASLDEARADVLLLTLPESIAWLLNIRGGDVPHTPMPLSFALLHRDATVQLFVDGRKISEAVRSHFGTDVRLHEPSMLGAELDALAARHARVQMDPATAAAWFFERYAGAGGEVVRAVDPCLLPKACKNDAELRGARDAHVRDGAALTKFLAWVKREGPKGTVDEIAACVQLEEFRRSTGVLRELSFDTISGSGPNGAIVHYRVTQATNRKLRDGDVFLIDSGAQYEDGTTDVTRTVAIGAAATPEIRDRFTRVLQGHIALARAVFPEGTAGLQLDALARQFLWNAGLDYDHGTGHGVGSFLSVHEGPQSISKRFIQQPLRAGMICSNEPGYYKSGAFGIRLENLVAVTRVSLDGAERSMLGFETLTLAPFDRDLIEPSLLNSEEKSWLNAYHARVCAVLTPLVDAQTASWLAEVTKPIA